MNDLFKHRNYREFLKKEFPGRGEKRGRRRSLSKILDCQTSFISLVLTNRAHLNEDMLYKVALFLKLNGTETEYLLNLYHQERAGSKSLQQYYQNKIDLLLKSREQINDKIGSTASLSIEAQSQYYSSWSYSAILTAIQIPEVRTLPRIATRLKLSLEVVQQQLDFLEKWNFVIKIGEEYRPGVNRLHLTAKSPFISQHHRNWYFEAIKAIDEKRETDLNYTGVLSLSTKNLARIKEILIDSIGSIETEIKNSPDETIVGLTIGLFGY